MQPEKTPSRVSAVGAGAVQNLLSSCSPSRKADVAGPLLLAYVSHLGFDRVTDALTMILEGAGDETGGVAVHVAHELMQAVHEVDSDVQHATIAEHRCVHILHDVRDDHQSSRDQGSGQGENPIVCGRLARSRLMSTSISV